VIENSVPIVFVDTETTGVNPPVDYIVQIACIKMYPDGRDGTAFDTLVKPPIAIPPEVTAVHHITDDMVKDAPAFRDIAGKLKNSLAGCDFAGFNVSFDLDMLQREFERVGIAGVPNGRAFDAMTIYRRYHGRTLTDAVREYLGEEVATEFETVAHNARTDISFTRDVLFAMLERHTDLPREAGELSRLLAGDPLQSFFTRRYAKLTFRHGKHAGESLNQVTARDPSYLRWIIGPKKPGEKDFNEHVKHTCREALAGRFA
jgi:DNA polymerase III subunit epsilon